MSKTRTLNALSTGPNTRISFLHPLEIFSGCAPAAPSVAAKLRLMARFAALAVLGNVCRSFAAPSHFLRIGGAYRDRTDDLMLAKQPLSQLS